MIFELGKVYNITPKPGLSGKEFTLQFKSIDIQTNATADGKLILYATCKIQKNGRENENKIEIYRELDTDDLNRAALKDDVYIAREIGEPDFIIDPFDYKQATNGGGNKYKDTKKRVILNNNSKQVKVVYCKPRGKVEFVKINGKMEALKKHKFVIKK